METPSEWSVGAVNGDRASGYLRVDDAEMPRLEIRWEPARGEEPIDRVVNRYLSTLIKKSGRKTPAVKVRRGLSLLKPKPQHETDGQTVECFHWRFEGDEPVQAYGLLWRCETCGRIVFVQVLGRAGETIQPVAARVLNSLRDHPADDTAVWAVYGMRIEVPVAYTLKSHQFLTGRIVLRFSDGHADLEIERLSLAEMHLEDRGFAGWFSSTNPGGVERQETAEDESWRHKIIVATGVMPDPATANRRLKWLPWRRPKIRCFCRCGWHCPQGNKLYTVHRVSDAADRAHILSIAKSCVCH